MVMALGVIAEAKTRARAEGREAGIEIGRKQERERMIQEMRDPGIAEADIQEIIELRNAGSDGSRKADKRATSPNSRSQAKGATSTMVLALGIIATGRAKAEGIEIGRKQGIERAIEAIGFLP